MKKRWKIFWIVCISLLLAGLICCRISWKMGTTITDIAREYSDGHGIGIYSDEDDEEDIKNKNEQSEKAAGVLENNGKASYQNVRAIKSNLYAGRLVFRTQADIDAITVESKNLSDRLGFQAYEKDGTLYLQSNKKIKNTKNIGKGTITVTIPQEQQFDQMDLTLKAGELKADRLQTSELKINAGAGEVNILEFAVDNARFKCGAGSVTAAGDAKKKIKADCGVGEIDMKLNGKKEDYNYDMECGIGQISCGEKTYSGVGKEFEIDNGAGKQMEIDCGIGEININYLNQM